MKFFEAVLTEEARALRSELILQSNPDWREHIANMALSAFADVFGIYLRIVGHALAVSGM